MCGIVGYIGNQKASPILISGLLRLEYRGYDSSGIATIENGIVNIMKDKGRVKNLYNLKGIEDLKGTLGIAHTRWATHGKPSKENSHPHMDNSKKFSVVHNGIIENYNELREFLIANGYTFYSQTDTEIIPNLIHYYYTKDPNQDNSRILRAFNLACKDFKGSFAIELLSSLEPNKIYVVRKDSPLVIGHKKEENYISSDIPAILSFTRNFYLLNDFEFAILTKDSVDFYDNNLNVLDKNITKIEWNTSAAEKDGFEDFMLKEIHEQPTAVRETLGSKFNMDSPCEFDELDLDKQYLENINHIYIVACGTAMHAGLVAKNMIEKLCGIQVTVDIASEFRYRNPLIDSRKLCIFVSQSGETADTIAALKLSKANNAKTIAISNVMGSSITREADYSICTHAGPEISVASTKAYTSQIALFSILAIHFSEILEKNIDIILELKQELSLIPKKIEDTLQVCEQIKKFASKVSHEHDMFFLGRGIDEAVSKEGSLKLKELSYIHAESYASGELKHGPIALIEDDITVINIITDKALTQKSISNIQEVITRGAKTLLVTNQDVDKSMFNEVITIPSTHPYISPILSVIPLQLLAYYISKFKGLDVDKPRNLAKSVTVE